LDCYKLDASPIFKGMQSLQLPSSLRRLGAASRATPRLTTNAKVRSGSSLNMIQDVDKPLFLLQSPLRRPTASAMAALREDYDRLWTHQSSTTKYNLSRTYLLHQNSAKGYESLSFMRQLSTGGAMPARLHYLELGSDRAVQLLRPTGELCENHFLWHASFHVNADYRRAFQELLR
jgi:hypothetical protein